MKLSVVIPTAGGSDATQRLLSAWGEISLDQSWELILAAEQVGSLPEEISGLVHSRCLEATEVSDTTGALNLGLGHALGDVILIFDERTWPTQELLETHLRFHQANPEAIESAAGPVVWDAECEHTALMIHLAASAHGRLKQADRVPVQVQTNTSFKASMLQQTGGFNSRLSGRCRDIELGRRLVCRGVRTTYQAGARALRREALSNDAFLTGLTAHGAQSFDLYGVDADALPRVTRSYGLRLMQARSSDWPVRSPTNMLSGALQGGVPDAERLDRVRDVATFQGFIQQAGESWISDSDTLPLRFHRALDMARTVSLGAAEVALIELQSCSPLVVVQARVRLMIKEERFEAAAEAVDGLLDNSGWGFWPELQLLSGELALAVGQLEMAEAAFAALYESSWRVIDSAWAIARLYRKYGPAPLGRPHLDRILDDREGRSASDIREVIDPASGMMEQLP